MAKALAIFFAFLIVSVASARSGPAPGPGSDDPALMQASSDATDRTKEIESWVSSQVARGEKANLDIKCGPLKEVRANDPCRELSAEFVQGLLRQDEKTNVTNRPGFKLNGAIIAGDLDLSDARVTSQIFITNSYFDGNVDFTRSHLASNLTIKTSMIMGDFQASAVSVGGDLELEQTSVGRQVNLIGADVEGFGHLGFLKARQLVMDSSHFKHDLVLDNASLTYSPEIRSCGHNEPYVLCGRLMVVDGQLSMAGRVAPAYIYLADSEIHGDLTVGGVAKYLDLDSIRVGGTLHMQQAAAEFGEIVLKGAEINYYWHLDAKRITKLNAEDLHVKQQTTIVADIQILDLNGAKFDGDLTIGVPDSNIGKARITLIPHLKSRLLAVSEDLTVQNAHLSCVDLSQAKIGDRLQIRNVIWSSDTVRTDCSNKYQLVLNNAKVGSALGELEVWPKGRTDLHGFVYGEVDIGKGELNEWLERDPRYEPQTYTHLAGVLAAEGDRDGASDVQYAARERDLSVAWRDGRWAEAIVLFCLKWLGSYGIGDKIWWCIVPTLALAVAGTFLVNWMPGARGRGPVWLFCAALHSLLPYHPIDRSIAEFFDKQENFRWRHKVSLFAFWLVGVVLAVFLAAAATGLTQKG